MAKTTVIRVKDLKSACDPLERVVLRLGAATEEELKPNRPGGEENPQTDVWGWKRWNDVLHRYHSKVQFQQMPTSNDAGDNVLLQALRAESILITSPLVDESTEEIRVYPKSFEALMECHKRDHLIGWLAVRYQFYYEQNGADDLTFVQRILDEMKAQYAVLAWIVTHPGAGLPWWKYNEAGDLIQEEWSGSLSDIPGHLRNLDIIQYLLIIRAYARVNVERLHILRGMLSPEKPGVNRARPTWSLFFTDVSFALNTPSVRLMRDRSLGEIMATMQLRAVSAQDAQEDAKREVA